MFDLFNKHFYNMELTHPAITVSPDGGRSAYGWCSIYEIWNANSEKYREINLCAEYLDRPMAELAATLGEAGIHASRLQINGSSKGGRKKSINRSIKYIACRGVCICQNGAPSMLKIPLLSQEI